MKVRALAKLLSGPTLCLIFILFIELDPERPEIARTAGVALWMAVWWITEAVPLAVTALLPVILFPVLGILDGKVVAPLYFNHIIFLFIGGFLVALTMERWNLHKRIALRVLLYFGVNPATILLGFMVATAFLSMWISNTATTMMMVPIALAIVVKLEDLNNQQEVRKYSIGIFLGVAYSASIGGIATLVGTPPNLSMARILTILFPAAPEISFATWFIFAFPITIVFLIILWLFLSLLFCPRKEAFRLDRELFQTQYKELGPISFEEKVVLADFVALALLWLTRADVQLGTVTLPGWSRLFQHPTFLNDGSVAIAMAVILFILPSKQKPGERIADWGIASRLPWNIVLLFGGGFALASGLKESGLTEWLGHQFNAVGSLNPVILIILICLFVTFLTELTSNTATAEILLPIMGALAIAIQVNPLMLMIPATLSCSFAFMLPVATPPNAIVFGSERLRIADMVKVGIWLNLLGVIIITTALFVIGQVVLDIDLSRFPVWARI